MIIKPSSIIVLFKRYSFIIAISIVYLFFFRLSFKYNAAPFHEDETIYTNVTRLFFETGSLKAPDIASENVSLIGQYNWYGPMYGLFYGSIAKLFNTQNLSFPLINLILIILTLISLKYLPIPFQNKNRLRFTLLLCPPFLIYTFAFFPEILHIFFSTIQTILLVYLFSDEHAEKRNKYLLLFIISTLFFSFFRITHIFWIVVLLPLSKNKREFFMNFFICIFFAVWGALFIHYFAAPAYAAGGKTLQLFFEGHILDGIKGIKKDISEKTFQLTTGQNLNFILQITLFGVLLLMYVKSKSKFLLSVLFIFIVYYLIFILFYTTEIFFFNKQTACLFPLLIIALFTRPDAQTTWVVILLLVIFPITYFTTRTEIYERLKSRRDMELAPAEKSLKEIVNFIDKKKVTTILWSYYEWTKPTQFLFNMPVCSKEGAPLRYTTNIVDTLKPDSIIFKQIGRLQVDYILTKKTLADTNLELKYKNNYFYFYKNLRPVNLHLK